MMKWGLIVLQDVLEMQAGLLGLIIKLCRFQLGTFADVSTSELRLLLGEYKEQLCLHLLLKTGHHSQHSGHA